MATSFSTQTHISPRGGNAITWTDRHQATTTVVAIAVAVLAGVVLGILLSLASSGTGSSALHRAGGHAVATVAQAQHAAAAGVTATAGGEAATATHIPGTRSPARGGFAVGRAAGAGAGFIVLHTGTLAPVRGGFPGRSLGAGHAPAVSLGSSTASGG